MTGGDSKIRNYPKARRRMYHLAQGLLCVRARRLVRKDLRHARYMLRSSYLVILMSRIGNSDQGFITMSYLENQPSNVFAMATR